MTGKTHHRAQIVDHRREQIESTERLNEDPPRMKKERQWIGEEQQGEQGEQTNEHSSDWSSMRPFSFFSFLHFILHLSLFTSME